MIELTEQQWQALSSENPPRVAAPHRRETFVLVRADLYERLQGLLKDDSDYDPYCSLPLMNEVMAEDDANDPLLEGYQKYRQEPS